MLPSTMPDHDAERSLVFAWRMMAAGRSRCPALRRDMEEIAGARAAELLCVLKVFLVTLGNASRRRLCVGHPICRHRTPDEEGMLALIAARQNGDDERVASHLRWLILPERREPVSQSLAALADIAVSAGLRLEAPRRDPRPMFDADAALASIATGP
jgi:hypothetical protein